MEKDLVTNSNNSISDIGGAPLESGNSIEQDEIWEDVVTESLYYGKEDLSQTVAMLSNKYFITKKP